MEAIILAILGGLAFIALLGGIAYYLDQVYFPRTLRKEIIDSLETTERIGISDLRSNFSAVAKRWRLIEVGISDNKTYGLEAYVPRMEAAINLMKPFEDNLRKQVNEDGKSILLRK